MQAVRHLALCVIMALALSLVGCGSINSRLGGRIPPAGAGTVSWVTQEDVPGNTKPNRAYDPFFAVSSEGALIPGLKQGLVPQSVGYLPDQDWFIIAGYRDGATSLVTIVDAASQQLIKTVAFRNQNGTQYTGHAGGLATSDQHLWLSSGDQVHYIALDQVINAADGETLQFAGRLKVDARASFVSYADGILWVGDFAYGTSYPTKSHHHLTNRGGTTYKGWVAGYQLDAMTDLIPPSRPKNSDGAYIPNFALSIPDKIQEMSVLGDKIVLTESYGRNNVSRLFIHANPLSETPHTHVKVGHESVPVWFLDSKNRTYTWTLPPMAEGIVERDGQTHLIFESAALKYLDGSYALSRLQVVDTSVLLGGDR